MKGMFDRQAATRRGPKGAYLTRDAAHPAADEYVDAELAASFELMQEISNERRLRALSRGGAMLPPRSEALDRLSRTLKAARVAQPFLERAPGGDLDRIQRVPQPAASILHFQIGEDRLPDFDAPEANRAAGERLTLSDAVLLRSRVMRAGARLLAEPKGKVTAPGGKFPALHQVPVGLKVVSPAPFAVVADDAEAPLSPLSGIIAEDRILRPEDMNSHAFRVLLSRREVKDLPDDKLLNAVLHSITLGLAAAADAELLGAIRAAAPAAFTLGAAAAKGLNFADLRAIIGPADREATGDRGELFWRGIPAELAAAGAPADRSVIAAFDRFGIALGGEVRVLIKRMDAYDNLEITCWAGMRAIVPDAGFAWLAPAQVSP